MYRYAVTVSIALLLSACANIEHKTPEARQHIRQDLKLTQITDTSTTSFCWFRIGGRALCKYLPGISVLTPDSLLLVDYEGGAYVQKGIIKPEDVKCISEADGHNFYVFTDQLALSVIPFSDVQKDRPQNNPEYRAKAIKLLLSKGQPYLSGEAIIIKNTGQKEYSVHNGYGPGAPIPVVVGTEVRQIVSPCKDGPLFHP